MVLELLLDVLEMLLDVLDLSWMSWTCPVLCFLTFLAVFQMSDLRKVRDMLRFHLVQFSSKSIEI